MYLITKQYNSFDIFLFSSTSNQKSLEKSHFLNVSTWMDSILIKLVPGNATIKFNTIAN